MLKDERKKKLLEIINKERVVTIADLCKELDVSNMTVWRDLDDLANEGTIERVRGGAIAHQSHSAAQTQFLLGGQDPHAAQKAAIGRYAAQNLVCEGDFMIVEAGTTASSIIAYLQTTDLTILTNGLLTSLLAHQAKTKLTLMCSGGVLIETGAFTGPQAVDFFERHRVNKAFLSASGLTLKEGFTDPTPLYLPTKKAMMANADQINFLITSSKIGIRSLLQVASFENIDNLVTDAGISDKVAAALEQQGIRVHVADL